MYNLGIEGGTLVTASGRAQLNLYIKDGLVAAVTSQRMGATELVDATGLLVMPGMVDSHVHLMDPSEPERESFPAGTAAAARAGVTTVIEHTHSGPVRTVEEFEEKRRYLCARSRVDYALAAHVWPDRLTEVVSLWNAGIACFKAFTCTTHGVPGFDAARLRQLFQNIAAVNAICLVHCEDDGMTTVAREELQSDGRSDAWVIPQWRHRDAELTALVTATFLARRTGVRMIAAHVSSAEGLAIVAREQASGGCILAEGCPQYFVLKEDEVVAEGPFRKFTPPARAQTMTDQNDMWQALQSGGINLISSDHAPSTRAQKTVGTLWEAPFGLPGLDTTLPVLLDAAAKGLLSYGRIVEAYSEAPARAYGLFPRKGSLKVGADADIVLVDPGLRWTVADSDILSGAGWSPYSGRTLVGRAVRTYLRGSLVCDDGRVLAEPGMGEFVAGPGYHSARGVCL